MTVEQIHESYLRQFKEKKYIPITKGMKLKSGTLIGFTNGFNDEICAVYPLHWLDYINGELLFVLCNGGNRPFLDGTRINESNPEYFVNETPLIVELSPRKPGFTVTAMMEIFNGERQ